MKPGYKTTEFWGKAVVTVVGLLVGSGTLKPEIGSKLIDTTNQALAIVPPLIDAIIQLAGLFVSFYLQLQYGKNRTEVKKSQQECQE